MKDKFETALWALLSIATLSTIFVANRLWMSEWQGFMLASGALVALAASMLLVMRTGLFRWQTFLVLLALAVGQWWLISRFLVLAFWSTRGFAP